MGTSIVEFDSPLVTEIQAVADRYNLQAVAEFGNIQKAFAAAEGMRQLNDFMSDNVVQSHFMPLMNSQVGFKTDRPNGYDVGSVKNAVIAALMHGVNVVGNEFNIISGSMYITKNGFNRLVREYPDLYDLVLKPGIPQLVGETGALVPYEASWSIRGERHQIQCTLDKETGRDTRIPVKVNRGMGSDAILGKAERKVLARIYAQLLGAGALPEGDVSDVIDAQFETKSTGKTGKKASDDLFE